MSEPIYYSYRCAYPPCHSIHAEPDQAAQCHGEEPESVYQCGRCERPHLRQREAEDCCDIYCEPLPDELERSIGARAINRGTW